MPGEAIFGPFFSMLLLTFVVWVYLYVRRLAFIKANNIDAQQLTTPVRGEQIIPEEVSYPSYNFRNLFELPVVFYALCLYLYVTHGVDEVYVIAAWGFFGLRLLHSLIHSTKNIVMLRFIAYMASALTLWLMVLRAAIDFFLL